MVIRGVETKLPGGPERDLWALFDFGEAISALEYGHWTFGIQTHSSMAFERGWTDASRLHPHMFREGHSTIRRFLRLLL